MTRIACGVEYDGSQFFGWQRQHHARSVQAEVEAALSKVANEDVQIICAGRTDTGVHGTGQVIHFDTDAIREDRNWVLGANAAMPDDVALRWAQPVSDDFHARFSATSRRYQYVIHNVPVRSPLYANRSALHRRPLDAEKMHIACQALLGEHDFTAFRAAGCQARHPVRTINAISVSRKAEFVILDIEANAFLMHMVRNITGSLIAIGQGDEQVDWIQKLLEGLDRCKAGFAAPPQGLCLVDVGYPADFELPAEFRPALPLA